MRSCFPALPARSPFPRLAGALAFTLALAVAAPAQDPQPPADAPNGRESDPKAAALLDEVSEAYRALGSYSDQGRFVIDMTENDRNQKQEAPLRLTFTRPNKLNLDAGPVKVVSDGQTINTVIGPLKKYIVAPAPEAIDLDVFREGPVGAVLFGGPSGVPMYILVNMLTAPEPAKIVEQLGGSLKLAGDDAAPALIVTQPNGPGLKLSIDPKTKLLTDIDMLVDPRLIENAAKQGKKVKIGKLGWTSGAISTEPAEAPAFAFEAPEGFDKVASLQEAVASAERPKAAVEGLVDKPAPDFALSLFDGPDKTKTVTKADLAGKVVVIDFWATWCAPCLAELPEIQKLVDEFAKDDARKDVLVIALSQDREPEEPAEIRELIAKTLAEKKIELDGKPNVAIGMDPANAIGELFKVEGIPTLVVIDAKGDVRAAHVGFSPDIRERLTAEIDAILAGKPLPSADEPEGEADAEPAKG